MSLLSGIVIMILHELPKSIVYSKLSHKKDISIWKLFQYIDPIGLIFCVTTYAGFSRPYMYRIKEKKTNFILGITGFLSLFFVFSVSIVVLRTCFTTGVTNLKFTSVDTTVTILSYLFWYFCALLSCGMIFVNLFPISTFDLGLLVAGKSPSRYFSIIRGDYMIKMLLALSLLLGIINLFSRYIIQFLITVKF